MASAGTVCLTPHGADGNWRSRLARGWLEPAPRQAERRGPPLMPALYPLPIRQTSRKERFSCSKMSTDGISVKADQF